MLVKQFFSEDGYNDVKYPFALGKENIYYMLYQSSTMNDEYQYLYKKTLS